MYTVTLDTNCINSKRKDDALNCLEDLERQGILELRKTDALDIDLMSDTGIDAERRCQRSATLPEDMGVFILDQSRLDHARLAGDTDGPNLNHVAILPFQRPLRLLGENGENQSVRDVMHLYTHIMHGRDYFVTRERAFLRKREDVLEEYGTRVGTPEECVEFIQAGGAIEPQSPT